MPQFVDLHTEEDLARAVGVPADRIAKYASSPNQADYYVTLAIPKRGGRRREQRRTVYKARSHWLTQLHYWVARLVVKPPFPEHVQGFVQGRSILTNAKQHLGARIVLHADIAGFFDAITVEQVEQSFALLGSPRRMASVLARVCTIDGRLRQGTRCAPALANLVCRHLDVDLQMIATTTDAWYTRYADDLTFSGDEVPNSDQVRDLLHHHGFELRDDRCYTQRRGHGQYVTGLTVNDAERPRLPRQMKRRMRLVLHFVQKYGVEEHFAWVGKKRGIKDLNALEGWLSFFHAIEPELTAKLRALLRAGIAKSTRDE
jgi:RNA-directed DNA polymerase